MQLDCKQDCKKSHFPVYLDLALLLLTAGCKFKILCFRRFCTFRWKPFKFYRKHSEYNDLNFDKPVLETSDTENQCSKGHLTPHLQLGPTKYGSKFTFVCLGIPQKTNQEVSVDMKLGSPFHPIRITIIHHNYKCIQATLHQYVHLSYFHPKIDSSNQTLCIWVAINMK